VLLPKDDVCHKMVDNRLNIVDYSEEKQSEDLCTVLGVRERVLKYHSLNNEEDILKKFKVLLNKGKLRISYLDRACELKHHRNNFIAIFDVCLLNK